MAIKTLVNPEVQPDWNRAEIKECNIDSKKRLIRVVVSKGYDDGSGNLIHKKDVPVIISDLDYDTVMDAMGDPLKMQKDQLEDAVWVYIDANIPELDIV